MFVFALGGFPLLPDCDNILAKKIQEFLKLFELFNVEILTYGLMMHVDLTKNTQVPVAVSKMISGSLSCVMTNFCTVESHRLCAQI